MNETVHGRVGRPLDKTGLRTVHGGDVVPGYLFQQQT